jgi:hypothetical protein
VLRQYAFDVLLMITCVYSVGRGGPPERWVAVLLAFADIASLIAVTARPVRYHHDEYGLLLVDGLLLVALHRIALRSTRWWPLYVTAFQLIAVGVHVMRIVAPHTLPMTYFNVTAMCSYPMVLALFAGTWRHRQRLAFLGQDPAWKAVRSDV